MKTKLALSLCTLVGAASLTGHPALAQHKPADMSAMPASAPMQATHTATGVVKKVDAAAGSVTIAHGPVTSLHWPAMTMAFRVETPGLLDKFTVGQKTTFDFRQQGPRYVITKVE
jgi:Cu(I)/Ag(I) efflux system protein CusF